MQTRIKIFLNTSAICPYATNTPSFRSIHFNHRIGSRCFLLLFQSYRLGKEPPPSVKVHSFWCRHRRRQAQTWPTCAIDLLVMLVGEVLKGRDVDKREKSVQVKEMVEDTRSGGRAAKRGDRGWMHLTHQNTERTSDCRMRSQRAQPTTTYLIHSLHTYTHTYTSMYIIYIYIYVFLLYTYYVHVHWSVYILHFPEFVSLETCGIFLPEELTKLSLNTIVVLFIIISLSSINKNHANSNW